MSNVVQGASPGPGDIRSEYQFDYSRAKLNRFASRTRRPVVAVVLESDVADIFDSSTKVDWVRRHSEHAPLPYTFLLVGRNPSEPLDDFNVNYAGCGFIRDVLAELEVLDTATPMPDFPKWPPPGISRDREMATWHAINAGHAIDSVLSPDEERAWRELEATEEVVRRWPSPYPGKVPAFKFQSNDSWLVAPDECASIAQALEAALADFEKGNGPLSRPNVLLRWWGEPEADMVRFLSAFAAFCARGVSGGGFRVR